MPEQSPAWHIGFVCALEAPGGIMTDMAPLGDYTDAQREDYVSGFLAGAAHVVRVERMREAEA